MDKQNLKIKIGDLEFKNPLFCGSAEHFIEEAGIKKAVEDLFDVKVDNVTTATQKGKTKRNRFGIYKKSDYKKAYVVLKEGSEIQFEGIS